MRVEKRLLTAILVFATIPAWAVFAAGLSVFDIPGAASSSANGINDGGEIVGTFVDTQGRPRPYVFRRGSVTVLDLPDRFVVPLGINDRGQIVGIAGPNQFFQGFIWDDRKVTRFSAPDVGITYFHDINNRGRIVGHVRRDDFALARGFLFVDGQFKLFDVPGVLLVDDDRGQMGINDREQIVGSFQSGGITHGFLLDAGVVTQIDVPGAKHTFASGINNRGQIAGFHIGVDSPSGE